MNVKLLRKVKTHILEEPKRLYMWDFLRREGGETYHDNAFPKCGTVGCIAGWACELSGKNNVRTPVGFKRVASKLLGLNRKQANIIFEPSEWPVKFAEGHRDDGKKKTAKVAAARIEHFIKTKGRE